jgi:predicted transcriptional regulator
MASDKSKIIGVRIPKTIIHQLDEEAVSRNRSRNYVIVEALEKKFTSVSLARPAKKTTTKKAGAR